MRKSKLVCGVGINDADYAVRSRATGKDTFCPYYKRWADILKRCYSIKSFTENPTYQDCSISPEWIYFSNFRKWMEQQDWQDKELDKDFLVEGNKVYSPETCLFLPQEINSFTTTAAKRRGSTPLGVSYTKKKNMRNELVNPYRATVNDLSGKSKHLGYYPTPETAHRIYLREKLGQCEYYIYKFGEDSLLKKGLTRIKNKIQYHINNNLELTSF